MSLIDDLKRSGAKPVNNPGSASQPVSQPNNNSNRLINDLVKSGVRPARPQSTPSPVQTVAPQPVAPAPTPAPAAQPSTPSFLNNLLETLGIASQQAQRAVTGVQAPVETQQAENNRLAELGAARAGTAQERKRLEEIRAQVEQPQSTQPKPNPRRDEILSEMRDMEANAGYITDEQTANEQEARWRELTQELRELDRSLGEPERDYTSTNAARDFASSWAQNYGNGIRAAVGSLGQLGAEVGARLHDASSDEQRAVASSDYSGWATDELSAANIAAGTEAKTGAEIMADEKESSDRIFQEALEADKEQKAKLSRVLTGRTPLEQTALQVARTGLDVLSDTILSAMTAGVGGQLRMYGSVYGQGAMEQAEKGGDVYQRNLAGAKAALSALLSTKLLGGVETAYGKSVVGKASGNAIRKLAAKHPALANPITQRVIRSVTNTEGLEEGLEDILNYAGDRLLNLDRETPFDWDAWKQDMLIGHIIGSVASGVEFKPADFRLLVDEEVADAAGIVDDTPRTDTPIPPENASPYQQIAARHKSTIRAANDILRNPEALASFVEAHGELTGASNTERAGEIAAILRAEQTGTVQLAEPAQRGQEGQPPLVDRPRGMNGPTEAEANKQTSNRMADIILEVLRGETTPAKARQIVDNPTLRALYETVYGVQLPDSRAKAKQMVLDSEPNPEGEQALAEARAQAFTSPVSEPVETAPAQQAAETPTEAAQPVGDIPAPPQTTESTTAQPQALNSATVEEPTQKRRAADVASDLINRTGTTQSREAVTAAVQEIADYIKSNNNGEGVDPEVLRQMAERAASEMLDNIPGTQTGDPTVYNALRDFLTGRNIEISDELRGDVTDYNDWRKSLFGKLNMRKEGVSIDTLYSELSTQLPGLFPSDITAHSDQINRIVDVLESTRPQAGRLVDEISDADYNGLLDEATQAILDAAPDVLSTETSMSEENLASLDETAPPELLDMSRLQGTAPAVEQTANGTEATPRRSQTESHTLQDVAKKNGGTQEKLYYIPTSERQTMTEAMNRVNADMVGEMNSLADKDMWTAADIDTGMTIYGMLKADAVRTGDNTAANAWAKVVQSRGTKSGQALQAFSKWTRSAAGQASYAADQIAEASNLSSEEKTRITNDIYNFAADIDGVEEGDVSSLREIIKRQSDYRGTGTIFEKNFEKILDQITDYEYLREYAQRQLMSMASDATDTATLGDKLKTWQVNAQLSRLGTFFRNIGGNVLFGAQDTLTQDGLGVALDWLVSKGTGKRTVGFDKSWFSAEARKGAKEAMLRSILEVAGDVNMDGDASKYGTTANRTNKMSGGKFSQFMSRWEQILGYSLTTSDRTSRGSIETAIRESLQNSGLTDAEIDAIAEGTADYRLFQNQDLAYKVSKGLHDVMNLVGVGGEVRGVTRSGGFGAGDLVNPYPGVPANLAVKALEYSPANIMKGGVELFNLFRDIKNGTYDATKQNRAVMDIARGMAGTPIIALLAAAFKTGIIKNSDDEDDLDVAAQNRAEGKSGVQINLDAWGRANKGESAEWKDGDDLLSIGWLEPMSAFMAIASMIAAEDDRSISTVTGDYFSGALQGLLEMPVMGNIANVVDSFRYSTADKLGEKVSDAGIGLLGDAASGMIPAPISQAARTSDLYYRDTGGDNKTEQVINNLLSSIPGARQTLPTKLDNFGRPKEYSNSAAQRFLNNFVLPGAVNELNQSDESKALEQLREASGETSFYPDRKAPSKVNLPGENGKGESVKLTTEEKRAYQEAYGGTYTDLLSDLLAGGAWGGMTTEAQTETAKAIEAYAKDEAKRAIAEAQGREYKSDYDDERKLPADSLADYFGAKESLKLASDNKDYSTLDALIDTLDEYPEAVRDKLSEDITRLDDMKAAADKGINSEEWTRAYEQYKAINKKDEGATDKAEEMKTWLRTGNWTKSERELLESQFKYYTSTPAEAKTYDKLDAALNDPKKAQHYSGLVRSEDADNAAEVLTTISNDRQYSLEDKEKALSVYLTEGQYAAYERAKAEKISMGNWAKFLSEVSKAHVERTGKGGNPSKADIQAACNAMGWTTKADFNQVYKVYKGN